MARRRLTEERIKRALARHDVAIRRAFEVAIRERRESINLRALAEAIEARDIGRAVDIAGLTRGDMFPLDQAARTAYFEGAQTVPAAAPAFAARIALDGNAPRAVEWARNHVGGLITEIIEDNRTAIRGIITQQLAEGVGPRQIASKIAGAVSPTSRMREGGFIGLDGPRLDRLNKVASALGTKEGIRSLIIEHRDGTIGLKYKVNRATANRIMRAYKEGVGLSPADQAISFRQYSNALLLDRAETIARTESITALRAGRHEGILQAVEQGAIAPDAIKKVWSTSADDRVREDHVAMDGEEVDGMEAPFTLPDGSQMIYPGDSSLGADGAQTINCRCVSEYRVDWLRG
jgi:hypothetical protein